MNLHMGLWINSRDRQQLLSVGGCLINVKRFFRCATMIHLISVGPLRQQFKLPGESDHPLLHIMDISE